MHNWRKKFSGKTVVAGISRLERLQGLPLKLLAIERFLREEPYWRDKLFFSMIGITYALEDGSMCFYEFYVGHIDKIMKPFSML
jgi:trehalose-6-phosphate synthase